MTTEITETEQAISSEVPVGETVEQKQVPTAQEPLVATVQTEAFLVEEIARNKEVTKKTWRWGCAAVLILIFYFTALISSVKSVIFDPEGISAILVHEFNNQLPGKLGEFENAMISQAPKNADSVVLAILGFLPNIRLKGEHVINEVHTVIPLLGEEVASTIKAYISENREDLQEFAKTHTEAEFASHFMDELSANVMMDLDIKLKQVGEKNGLNAVKATSLERLIAINSYLEKLANTNRFSLTEKEQLERRTIATWLKLLDWDATL